MKNLLQKQSRYDTKLTTFIEETEKKLRVEIKAAKVAMHAKYSNLMDHFIKLKQDCEDEVNGVFYQVANMEERK